LKQTISRILLQHALDFLGRAEEAANEKRAVDEISACIGAHLMIAITVEGIANELGAAVFGGALLDHFDRADTVMKWYLLSGFDGRVAFDFGQEPLQTIQMVVSMRNRIAHPKVENFGDEVMIRTSSGELLRNVSLDHPVQAGDQIIYAAGEHLKKFNHADTKRRIQKCILAVDALSRHLAVTGLEWTEQVLAELKYPEKRS
jgi:hypothetical protein